MKLMIAFVLGVFFGIAWAHYISQAIPCEIKSEPTDDESLEIPS